ncbi:hypothetical protein PMAYCL1PPCAC_20252, partial [Pristionchus mayeri]
LCAIATLSVVLGALAPNSFMNGFLGVDTCFVLTGYFIATMLSRESTIDGTIIKAFYARCFKRIVPLYSFMLLILTVITPFVLLPTDLPIFITDLKSALPLALNFQNVFIGYDFWSEVLSSSLLMHTWAIGVVVQYCLIVPFLDILIKPNRKWTSRKHRTIGYVVLFGASLALHLLSSAAISFDLIFSRLWQFLLGNLALEVEQMYGLTENGKVKAHIALKEADGELLLAEDVNDIIESGKLRKPHREIDARQIFRNMFAYTLSFFLIW